MSALTIHLPDSLFSAMTALAKKEGIALDNLMASAAAEKMSAMLGINFLEERAAQAPAREEFRDILNKVPNNQPDPGDEW